MTLGRGGFRLDVFSVSTTLGIAAVVAGWVWWLAGQAAKLEAVDTRVTAIEQRDVTRDSKLSDISDRLARMEPMLQFLVRDAQNAPHPAAR